MEDPSRFLLKPVGVAGQLLNVLCGPIGGMAIVLKQTRSKAYLVGCISSASLQIALKSLLSA